MLTLALALTLAAPPDTMPLQKVGDYARRPLDDDEYDVALVAAAHHFAEEGETRHLHALLAKHSKWVDQRLKFASPRKPSFGDNFTLLRRAIEHDHADIVALLIELKADVKADTGNGWTPLHHAVAKGNLKVVKLLVDGGADVNAATTALPRRPIVAPSPPFPMPATWAEAVQAYTVLDMAVVGKRDDVVKYLREKGAKPSER